MQIALYDIRRIGYQKLMQCYGSYIIPKISKLNADIYNKDDSAFSLLNNWGSLSNNLSKNFLGMYSLVNNYTPMIEEIGVEDINKRKFRNTWTKLWMNIEKDLALETYQTKILSDCGIRIANYIGDGTNVDREIVEFYDVFIKWGILSDKELNFKKLEMNHVDLIEKIALFNAEEFKNFILDNVN